jgi:hypothetical protein
MFSIFKPKFIKFILKNVFDFQTKMSTASPNNSGLRDVFERQLERRRPEPCTPGSYRSPEAREAVVESQAKAGHGQSVRSKMEPNSKDQVRA